MSQMQTRHWQLLAALSDGLPQHVFELSKLIGIKPQQINGLWQQMPPHIRGLLRQHDGQWRLVRPLAVFDEQQVQQIGKETGFQTALLHECTSSNDILLEKAKQSPQRAHRILCIAHDQSKGRGRQGKTWQHKVGECLMMSVGWAFHQPQHQLGALALVVALACHSALAELGVMAQIKWPNDLVIGADKLGGILIETVRNEGQTVAVIGIGLNFVLPKEVENATSVQAAARTNKHQINAHRLLATLLEKLAAQLQQFEAQSFAPMLADYQTAHRDHNRSVCLLQNGTLLHEGTVKGVNKQGALLLQTKQGLREIVSGEISLRANNASLPPPSPTHALQRHLLLDGGNSQLKWAWIENGEISEICRAPYRELSALGEQWQQRANGINQIIGCAVCGDAKKAKVAEQISLPIEWLSSMQEALGIRNHYRNIAEHGSDRWFNALGSRRFTQNACVVVSCGTAVTTDALTDDNHYLGGTIMPGFHLMKEAMALKTANLNRPIGRVYPFPTTTSNALASGMIDAVCGALILMHGRLQNKVGADKKVDIIITGGGASKVAQALPEQFSLDNNIKIVDNLVIYGLLNWIEQQ